MIRLERCERRARPAGLWWGIAVRPHERCAFKNAANYLALHSYTLAVDDTHISKTAAMGLVKVFLDDGLNLAWWYGVEVNHVGNLQFDGLSVGIFVVAQGWFRVRVGMPSTPELSDECEQFHRLDVIR